MTPDGAIAGLFAGVGGIELGLHQAGFETVYMCESWDPARAVLQRRFPDVPIAPDIRNVRRLPSASIVTAGFPCTDLSQAGRTAGIEGVESGLVQHALDLLERNQATWVVLENVRNMLALHKGRAMAAITGRLASMKYRWAYRVIDSRFTGVPQRRQRVFLVASRTDDPREVLFADDAAQRDERVLRADAFGFYWTEGLRGLGWVRDGVPTLKGGSTIGIPSPPAIWLPHERAASRFVTPRIDVAERLQGFRAGWTRSGATGRRGEGARWRLVGNAVTVGVSRWIGQRLAQPGRWNHELQRALDTGSVWPTAAWGEGGKAWAVAVSMWPTQHRHRPLRPMMGDDSAPLSRRGAAGFLERLERSSLHVPMQFRLDLKEYLEVLEGGTG
jgi:DNA (cytosine-5)-methyltransferase 1